MIKLIILAVCLSGVLGSPFQRFEVYDDVANEAEVIDAGVPLPGTRNLSEKRLPVLRLTLDSAYLGSSLWGNRNLAERVQVPPALRDQVVPLPGSMNLDEKTLPEAAIYQRSSV